MHYIFSISLRLLLSLFPVPPPLFLFFFFTAPATTEIYTLSLHDALPIYPVSPICSGAPCPCPTRRCGYTRSGADRKSTRLNSSHVSISYAVFCLKKKKKKQSRPTWRRRYIKYTTSMCV